MGAANFWMRRRGMVQMHPLLTVTTRNVENLDTINNLEGNY